MSEYGPPPPDIKPCPFCGSNEVYVVDVEGMEVSVFCEICHALGPSYDERCRDDVIAAWNKRP